MPYFAMRYLIGFLFFSPFWVQFLVAGGFVYLGFDMRHDGAVGHQAAVAQLAAPPPATVPITDFQVQKSGEVPQELSVTAQFASDHNTRLVTEKNGKTVGEQLMIVLVAPDAAADETVARAVIVFDPSQKDAMVEWLLSNATGTGGAGPVVTVSGLIGKPVKDDHVTDALRNQGMMKSSHFFFIEPFLNGREAGYQARIKSLETMDGTPMFIVASVFAALGLGKLLWRRKRKQDELDAAMAGVRSAGVQAAAPWQGTPGAATAGVPAPASAQFASWASAPAAPAPSTVRGEYLTVPKGLSTASLERIAQQDRSKKGPGLLRAIPVVLILGWFALQFAVDRVPGLQHAMGDIPILSEIAKPKAPAPGITVVSADVTPAADEATGAQEPWLLPLAMLTAVCLLLFILVQRRKASRL